MKKLFFDTEFTGLHKNTTLISLGIIAESGETFYAEFIDYDKSQVNDWIQKNVIDKLKYTDKITRSCSGWESWESDSGKYGNALEFELAKKDMKKFSCIGETPMIKHRLEKWFAQFGEEQIEMWSDCLAYDWVLFQSIFGTAFDMPKNIFYIPFDLAMLFKEKGIDPDINREKFAYGEHFGGEGADKLATRNKHNALWDAIVIKDCHEKLTTKSL